MFHSQTNLFAVISGPTYKKALSEIHEIEEKVDGIELRLDLIESLSKEKLSTLMRLPTIFTWKGGDSATLIQQLALEPAFVDLEWNVPISLFEEIASRFPKTKIICSYHNFNETPQDLKKLLHSIKKTYAHHTKVACTARSTTDSLRMLAFTQKTGCIGLCMGSLGTPTRILAPVVGTPLMYAISKQENSAAPGQLTIDELISTYRFRSLNKQTKIYGLIGNPVAHSPSHKIHNHLLSRLGVNAVYIKMCVEENELTHFFSLLKELPFCGLSVTAPYKEALQPYISTVDEEAQKIGAVNTLVQAQEGWAGFNTDGKGALDALGKVKGKKVIILGAGGAAKAIAWEAAHRGANLTTCNRTEEKGKSLAQQVGGTFSCTLPEDYDILINTTPLVPERLVKGATIMDLPSSPNLTPLLALAQKEGCRIVSGFEMFLHQAAGQLALWLPEKREQAGRELERIKSVHVAKRGESDHSKHET